MANIMEDIFPWFDEISEQCRIAKKRAKMEPIVQICKMYPSRKNLGLLANTVGALPFSININDIRTRKAKKNYRYMYHSHSRGNDQSSATGELFSLIRQAITYHLSRQGLIPMSIRRFHQLMDCLERADDLLRSILNSVDMKLRRQTDRQVAHYLRKAE